VPNSAGALEVLGLRFALGVLGGAGTR